MQGERSEDDSGCTPPVASVVVAVDPATDEDVTCVQIWAEGRLQVLQIGRAADAILAALSDARRSGRLEERQACFEVADRHFQISRGSSNTAWRIREAIRARGLPG